MAEDIAQWLDRLGLSQYAQAFADNGIDIEALPHLRDEDYEQLGVLLGHTRRLQAAIETLSVGEPPTRPVPPPSQEPKPQPAEAERRQLTVMFCDLVGSTAMSEGLDPEDMRDVIRAYQNMVAGEVARFEGHVAKFMGDGVLAYFGWPRAHEDEAERAARSGLSILHAIAVMTTPQGEPLAARIGIATGLVVVGDLVGEGAAQEEAVVGDTPNLAARLQALAEPGQMVVAEATRRLLGDAFDLTNLGTHTLKGISEPTTAFAVLAERSTESRFAARSTGSILPLIGRDEEIALLMERWRQARAGEGQMVLLTGEAGIGKSRIAHSLVDALAGEEHLRISYQCSPYYTGSALYPAIHHLTLAAGLAGSDSPERKLHKLEALLRQAWDDISIAAPLLGSLVGLREAAEARHGSPIYSPQQRRARTLEALVDWLTSLAAKTPVLFVLEDAHWIDPTTNELCEMLAESIRSVPILVVITARPAFNASWIGRAHTTALTLNHLGRGQGMSMVRHLTGGKGLPSEVLEQILAKTDGVPLFVEELTKAVIESGLVTDTGDDYVLSGSIRDLAIPASLHDSLIARLDRIPESREIAQVAACIGREFDYPLLAAVTDRPEADLQLVLDRLVEVGLVFRRGSGPGARYSFKHALVRDAAYDSLLRSRRRQLHAHIAQVLTEQFSGRAGAEPEILAYHYTKAGLIEPAIDSWLSAGRWASKQSANVEAISHLSKGLNLLAKLPETPERARWELTLQVALGPVTHATRGPGSQDTVRVYDRARELCETLRDTTNLWFFTEFRGRRLGF